MSCLCIRGKGHRGQVGQPVIPVSLHEIWMHDLQNALNVFFLIIRIYKKKIIYIISHFLFSLISAQQNQII